MCEFLFSPKIIRNKSGEQAFSLVNNLLIQSQPDDEDNWILTAYKSGVRSFFQDWGHVQSVDFESNDTVRRVNDWAKEQTRGLIDELLLEAPSNTSKLVLLNAIHFRHGWDKAFDVRRTTKRAFLNQGKTKVDTDFMHQVISIKYMQSSTLAGVPVQAVELPLQRRGPDSYSMIMILPFDETGLYTILSSHDFASQLLALVHELLASFAPLVHLHVPKFHLHTQLDLVPSLRELGITKLFNEDADLYGMSGKRNMSVSAMRHRASMRVDEEGTEAGALVAAVLDDAVRVRTSAPFDFTADRPFLFLMRDDRTGLIFFIGKIEEL